MFDGHTYDPAQDGPRLASTLARVYLLMQDGRWRTIKQVASAVGCSEPGASARLRDLRKPKFSAEYPNGGVDRRRVEGGLWEYSMRPPVGGKKQKALFQLG